MRSFLRFGRQARRRLGFPRVELLWADSHLLLELIFPVIDDDAIVVAVETVYEGLDGGFVEESDVARGLPGLDTHHHELGVYKPEAVYDDLALDGLDGVHHKGHCSGVEGLKRRLRINISPRKPAPKAWMGVIPADDHLGPSGLLQHVQHLCLEHRIDSLNTNSSTTLRHREDVDANNGEVIDCVCIWGGGVRIRVRNVLRNWYIGLCNAIE